MAADRSHTWPEDIRAAVARGELDRAERLAVERARADPDDPAVVGTAADVVALTYKLPEAKRWADRRLQLSPDDIEAHFRCVAFDCRLASTKGMSKEAAMARSETLLERAYELGADRRRLTVARLQARLDLDTMGPEEVRLVFDGLADAVIGESDDELSVEMWTLETTLIGGGLTFTFARTRSLLAAVGLGLLVLAGLGLVGPPAALWVGAVVGLALSWGLKVAAYTRVSPAEEIGRNESRRLYLSDPRRLFPHLFSYLRLVGLRLRARAVARALSEVAGRYSGIVDAEPEAVIGLARRAHLRTVLKHWGQLGLVLAVWVTGPVGWLSLVVLIVFTAALTAKTIVRIRTRLVGEFLDALHDGRAFLGVGWPFDSSTMTVFSYPHGVGTVELGDVPAPGGRRVALVAMAVAAAFGAGLVSGSYTIAVVLAAGAVLPALVVLRDHEVIVHGARVGPGGQVGRGPG